MMCLLEEVGGGKIEIYINESGLRENTVKVLGHLGSSAIDTLKAMGRTVRPQVGGDFVRPPLGSHSALRGWKCLGDVGFLGASLSFLFHVGARGGGHNGIFG